MTPLLFTLTVIFGIIVGILSGMFGIGGGTMMIPLLNLVFRLPLLASTATSLFVIAPTSISGAWRHVRQGTVDVRASVVIGVAGAVASTFSSFISDRLPTVVILVAAFSVIFYSAFSIIRGVLKKTVEGENDAHLDDAVVGAAGAVSTVDEAAAGTAGAGTVDEAAAGTAKTRFSTTRGRVIALILLGAFAGLVAGVVGVGGGFIIVPVGIAYFGYTFKRASGTSLLAIALIALPGIITHAILGHIWYLNGVALMIGTIPGANLGARLIAKVPERAARVTFAALLVVSGVLLVVNHLFSGG
jgi:uncharacterized membrane protein YfcA